VRSWFLLERSIVFQSCCPKREYFLILAQHGHAMVTTFRGLRDYQIGGASGNEGL
jgi:hypothetical protein